MRDVVVTYYTLQELKELNNGNTDFGPYAKALEAIREFNVQFDWWDCTYDWWKERLAQMGYSGVDMAFSGFWSQGDGASFTCESIDLEAFVTHFFKDAEQRKLLRIVRWLELGARIVRTSYQYAHENTVSVEGNPWWAWDAETPRVEAALATLRDSLEEESRNLMQELYQELEKEYEYLTSEEALLEMAEANEYEFTEEGALV
jgi:hypothetical protein